eukprot:scaffold197900_cov17-Tisochrysis_lutea.AAC.1
MTMITLTDTLTVGLPLEVMGWPDRVRAHCGTYCQGCRQQAKGFLGWLHTEPHKTLARHHSKHGSPPTICSCSGQGGSDSNGRVSVGVVYNALPQSSVM